MKKEENTEYKSLDFFRHEEIDKTIRKTFLNNIFLNLVIDNNIDDAVNNISLLNKDEIKSAAETLFNITYFCIEYNYPGKRLISILNETFDINTSICEDLEKLYNDNKISLKLDFIINYISDDSEE